jgi:hypothetical protein
MMTVWSYAGMVFIPVEESNLYIVSEMNKKNWSDGMKGNVDVTRKYGFVSSLR